MGLSRMSEPVKLEGGALPYPSETQRKPNQLLQDDL